MGPLDSSVFVENLSFSGYCSLFQSQGGRQSTHPIRIRKTACDKGLLTAFLLPPFCHRVWSPKHTQTHPFIWLKVKMTNRIIKSTAMNSLMFIKLLTHPNKKQKKPAEFITWNHPLIRPKTPERRMVFCNTCGGIAVRPESQRVWLATHLQLQLLKDVIGIAWQLTKHPKKNTPSKTKAFPSSESL